MLQAAEPILPPVRVVLAGSKLTRPLGTRGVEGASFMLEQLG